MFYFILFLIQRFIVPAKSLWGLHEHILKQTNGTELYERLPHGIKDIGGPACMDIALSEEKRGWNKTAHYTLPGDVDGSIQHLKGQFKRNPDVPESSALLMDIIKPRLRQAVYNKKNKKTRPMTTSTRLDSNKQGSIESAAWRNSSPARDVSRAEACSPRKHVYSYLASRKAALLFRHRLTE